MLLGFLHRGGLEQWSYAIAAEVAATGASFVRFTMEDVDRSSRTLMGEFWENGSWVRRRSRFPDAVRNFERPDSGSDGGDWILEFLPHTIKRTLSKSYQLQFLLQNPYTRRFVPSTETLTTALDVAAIVDDWGACILKPVRGRLGRGIWMVRCEPEGVFTLEREGKLTSLSRSELLQEIRSAGIAEDGRYLIQQFAAGTRPDGRFYNLRLIVQKSGDGDWHCCSVPVGLVGKGSSVVVNRDTGATNMEPLSLLRHLYGDR